MYINTKNDGNIVVSELITFFEASELPDILNGTVTPALKAQYFFTNMGCDDNNVVDMEVLTDFFIPISMATESDKDFRQGLLSEYNLADADLNHFISTNYPNNSFTEAPTRNVSTSSGIFFYHHLEPLFLFPC